jgi:uncharacterized membrane protein YeaQ/YmgE (transglycosylase-associated protein family)
MAILNCLWVGALAGLVASRWIRHRTRLAPLASSVAVGVLGALLGGLAVAWAGTSDGEFARGDFMAAAIGAGVVLAAWSALQKLLLNAPTGKNPAEGG